MLNKFFTKICDEILQLTFPLVPIKELSNKLIFLGFNKTESFPGINFFIILASLEFRKKNSSIIVISLNNKEYF